MSASKKDGLTNKLRVFCEEYLTCWNATEAARRAGYAGNYGTITNIGYKNLRKPAVARYIEQRLAEKKLTADEVLIGLAEIARGSMDDFLSQSGRGARIDITKAKKLGKLHLLKSFSKGRRGTAIELYSRMDAYDRIARILGLYVDRLALTDPTGKKEFGSELRDILLGKLSRVADAGATDSVRKEPEQ